MTLELGIEKLTLPGAAATPATFPVSVPVKVHEIYNYLHPMNLEVSGANFPPNESRWSVFQPPARLRPSSAVLSCPASGLW